MPLRDGQLARWKCCNLFSRNGLGRSQACDHASRGSGVLLLATIRSCSSVTQKHSDYMHWAKTASGARFNLASSGVAPLPISELEMDLHSLEINGENSYGYKPLQEAIARHCGTDPECVVEAAGTSMANHLAMAAMVDPGDEILIEHPTYGLILDTAHYLQVNVKRFRRREENGWAIDPSEIRKSISTRTKLIVVTNLHNPTSVLAPEAVLREVAGIAQEAGASVLVDEVYLDAVFDHAPKSSFHLGPNIIVTSSLTKIYGVSGLRCGWILARPELAWRMRRLNDLFGATPVHPGELMSVAAFAQIERLRSRSRRLIERDRAVLEDFVKAQSQLEFVRTPWGTTAFPRVRAGDSGDLVSRLRIEFETSVVPGHFFGMPDHFRIGFGVDSDMFAEGISRLSRALTR